MSKHIFRPILGLTFLVLMITISCSRTPTPVRLDYESTGDRLNLDLEVTGLRKSAPYFLSLNGKVNQDGNDCLARFKQKYGSEWYYDFASVDTDQKGKLSYKKPVILPKCKYDVTFLIKDASDPKYTSVIVRDHWRFEITKESP